MSNKIFSNIIITILLFSTVLAYVDPGTGVAIAGSLGPLIGGILATIAAFIITRFWKPIKSFFKKLFSKK